MKQIPTTVVAVIGTHARRIVEAVGSAPNVHAVIAEGDAPLDRAVDAWRDVSRTKRTYALHDADPLEAVVEAWVRLYDGVGGRGELEVAVAETRARWRAGSLELPDYYVVLDAAELSPTRRHWYLGHLHAAAPRRVVPVDARSQAVQGALPRLKAGRWWPELTDLVDDLDRVVPDAVVPPSGSATAETGGGPGLFTGPVSDATRGTGR